MVLFGQGWADSGPVAATLFLIGPALTLQVFSGSLLNAAGHPEVTLQLRLVTTVVHVIGFLIAVAVFRDIIAVAAAFVIGTYLLLPLNLYLQRRYAHISITEHLWQLRWVALSTLVMAVPVLTVKLALVGHIHPSVLLVIEIVTGMVVFTGALFVFERGLLREVVTLSLQALPAGERVARLFHIELRGKRLGRRMSVRAEAAAQADALAAGDLADDEPRALDH